MAYTFQKEGTNVAVFQDGKRIATSTPDAAKTQYGYVDTAVPQTPQQSQTNPPAIQPITSPVSAPTTVQSPTFPEPQAPKIQETFITSMTENADKTRKAVEDAYKTQAADVDKRLEESRKKFAEIEQQQEMMIETDIEPLLKPFREDLENTERERLYINENFEANQSLTRELDTLLTEGNALIRKEQGRFASRSSIAAGTARAIEDVNARAGVIQAVMSARSGQIAEAYRMIDRTVDAITADRQDQLTYYKTIFDFYENQKDEEGKKILNLEGDQKDYIKAQIGLLEKDMNDAKAYAENIKEAMTDPDTALLYATAGVKLTDSPEVVAKKVAEAAYAKEVRETSNSMAKSGYTFLAPGQSAPVGSETTTVTDSKGKTKTYYKAKSSSTSAKDFSSTDRKDFEDSYGWKPPVGVTQEQALAFMQANPDLSPEQLETQLVAYLSGKKGTGATVEETVTRIKDSMTAEQKKALEKKAKASGATGWFGLTGDINKFFETQAVKDLIQLGIDEGNDWQTILDVLTQ